MITFLLIVSVVPLVVLGILAARASGGEMMARIEAFQRASAKPAAESIDTFLKDVVNAVRLSAGIIPFEEFPPEERADAVRIPYRQFDFINIAVLLDHEGNQLAEPVFETYPEGAENRSDRESIVIADLVAFSNNIPFNAAQTGGAAFGPVYRSTRTNTPRIALAVGVPLKGKKENWVLAIELSLKRPLAMVESAVPKDGTLYIVDNHKKVIFHSEPKKLAGLASLQELPILLEGFKEKAVLSKQYAAYDDVEMAGTFVWIPLLGWGLVTEQPVSTAFKNVYQLRNYTLFLMLASILVAVVGGVMLARSLSKPLIDLAGRADTIAKGRFEQPLAVQSKDEIGQLAMSFNHMSTELKQLIEQYEKLFISSIHTLVTAVEAKDKYTRGHSERVTYLAVVLCDMMGLSDHDKEIAEVAGLLHDVGKIGVPEHVLNKKGRLSSDEFSIIKDHPAGGAKIVQKIRHADVYQVAAVVRSHHERWDGTGYPDGLKGREIPRLSRIMAVADAYDAMTTDRAYRKGLELVPALDELRQGAGTQFEKKVVDTFCDAVEGNLFKPIQSSKYVNSDAPGPGDIRPGYSLMVEK
jgi:putative nucleotidyltransferase with HDIG domain